MGHLLRDSKGRPGWCERYVIRVPPAVRSRAHTLSLRPCLHILRIRLTEVRPLHLESGMQTRLSVLLFHGTPPPVLKPLHPFDQLLHVFRRLSKDRRLDVGRCEGWKHSTLRVEVYFGPFGVFDEPSQKLALIERIFRIGRALTLPT